MSNLQTKLDAIKNKEVTASVSKQHNYAEGDVLKITGVQQTKAGKTKTILTNRLFVVTGDSKKGDMIRGILIDNNSNLQNCVITLPVDVMTKVGKYTEDGEVVEDISEVVEDVREQVESSDNDAEAKEPRSKKAKSLNSQ